jgi:hypothetical protein
LLFLGQVKVTLCKILVIFALYIYQYFTLRRKSDNGEGTLIVTEHVGPSWQTPDLHSEGTWLHSQPLTPAALRQHVRG